jgi:metal-responsive CopG/Arc/MetJ family transcriptional regulator
MGNLYRAQILLEPEQHRTLAQIAEKEGRSISEVVREIVGQYLVEREQETQLQREMQAIDTLTQIRRQIEQKHGVYQGDILSEIRAEREQEIDRVWGQEE